MLIDTSRKITYSCHRLNQTSHRGKYIFFHYMRPSRCVLMQQVLVAIDAVRGIQNTGVVFQHHPALLPNNRDVLRVGKHF